MSGMSVSPMVDSVSRLIHKKAIRVHARIAPENKRWIDLDDVIQDGFIAAWQAEQRYSKKWGTEVAFKESIRGRRTYCAYVYSGLDMIFSARYGIALGTQKRKAALVELDAPFAEGDGRHIDLAAAAASPERLEQAVSGILQVCCAVPSAAVSFLLQVVMSETGKIRRRIVDDIACIPAACVRFGVGRMDLEMVMADAAAKGRLLGEVMRSVPVLDDETAKVLECFACRGMFSLADARSGAYSAASLTCARCLAELHSKGPENSCFGRLKMVNSNRTVTEGFSEADAECRLHCRDREACKQFITDRERKHMTNATMDVDLEDVNFDDVEAEDEAAGNTTKLNGAAKGGGSKKVTKAAKKVTKAAKEPVKAVTKTAAKSSAKAAGKAVGKAAKPEKVETKKRTPKSSEPIDPKTAKAQGLIVLDDKGRDLPFKPGSMMRYCIEQALEPGGASEKALEKEVIKLGYDYKFQRTVLLSGKSGDSSLRPYPSTHTWKAEEKDGRIIVSNVKRVAFYHKMARLDRVPKSK